jgi:aldehyde dehydrogenase (NAD+)
MTDVEKRSDRSPVPADWTYAPAPESTDIVSLRERYGLFVGGKWIAPHAGSFFDTISPRDESPLAQVAQADEQDVAAATAAAREASETWSALAPSERAKYLFRIARILAERSREFAVLESLNGGKPIKESRPRTSSTTPAGPTSSNTRFRTDGRSPSASRARSSRGTSHC